MIKLAVFDWNGTLLADTKPVVEAFNQELAVVDHPPITVQCYREHYTTPTIDLYKGIGVDPKVFEANRLAMAKTFHVHYEPRAAKTRTRRGVRQTLETLRTQGITCIILSNHTVEGIYFQLERLGLGDYFSEVLANEALGLNHYQGKADRLQQYLAASQFKPSETIIIGDTVEEIHIGQRLKLKTIAITDGFNTINRLKQAKPDVLIRKIPDIVDNIKEF